jgi:magnesium chelatase family protein
VLATVRTFSLSGVAARPITVEVDVRQGLPALAIVGLPDRAVREARERVAAAISNSGFEFPQKRMTVNLAPASFHKAGPGFDLAIAAGILIASGQVEPEVLDDCAVAAELSLDGTLRPAAGALSMAEEAARLGMRRIVVAPQSGPEAALAAEWVGARNGGGPLRVTPLDRLAELPSIGTAGEPEPAALPPSAADAAPAPTPVDLADLRGQPLLRRALEISAAGGHGLLMVGPPGAGKSLAARCLPSLLPPLAPAEALEVRRIASACAADHDHGAAFVHRPFRAPHHTISAPGLVGGGSPPRAGEATLAHRGVLFLDELGEFARTTLEALRQPMEDGRVTIVRARQRIELPCRFVLVAAANPCPCGRGEDSPRCACEPGAVRRYAAKLSGALADRIDIVLGVGQPDAAAMGGGAGEPSDAVRERVVAARERQRARLGDERANGELGPAEIRSQARLTPGARRVLEDGHRRLELSGRGHDRILRVARTIADLAGVEEVAEDHVAEALGLRRRDPG